MYARSLPVCSGILVLFCLTPASAAEPASPEQVAAWIRDLGSEEFTLREPARRALIKEGRSVVPALTPFTKSKDAQVRRSASDIIEQIHAKERETELREWNWSDEVALLPWYLKRYNGSYKVEARTETDGSTLIQVLRDNKDLFSWKGHGRSPFVFVSEHVLVFAEYNPHASGCRLIAQDLESGKRIWEARLQGLGPVEHSAYSNRINLRGHQDHVTVLGSEGAGNYTEQVDLKTGKTIGHKVYPRK
jgi:hypothetical protein